MSKDPALETFLAESTELLAAMESVLLRCEEGNGGDDAVNELFRAAHTIKGSSGLFGLDSIVAFTHVVESVLDRARAGRTPVSPAVAAILLDCVDHIGKMVESIAGGGEANDTALLAAGSRVLERLTTETGFVPKEMVAKPATPLPAGSALTRAASTPVEAPLATVPGWHISVRFNEGVLKNGMDPLSFIRYLTTFGSIVGLQLVDDALPTMESFDAENCYLGAEIDYQSAATQAQIEAAFDFVREDCTLEVVPVVSAPPPAAVATGVAPAAAPTAAPAAAANTDTTRSVEARTARDTKSESRSIRVDGDKLDTLIDWIGELIIAGAATGSIARQAGLPALQESAQQLAHIVGEIRDQALKLRMVQIGSTFSRFQRVVRDVAREIGKDIGLEVTGSETELDRTLVEGIADPLTHLVRNAVDHGIEKPDVRQARGKPAAGLVRLHAYHDAGSVVIEVSDDGGGLKKERIVEKAVDRGIISAGQTLTDEQIYALIFEPGFSTAEQVTNLSGRGVGMDVVKRNITALRGTVEIQSEEGRGTRVRIRLPLTLAIIDGFQVGVGSSHFVIPLDLVEECVEINDGEGGEAQGHVNLHGAVLPLIRLRDMFDIKQKRGRRQSVVVVRSAGKRVGIVVDDLLGELQAVIKPLSKLFSQLQGIGGSTILGNGKVALILDIPGLVERTHALTRGVTAQEPKLREAAEHGMATSVT